MQDMPKPYLQKYLEEQAKRLRLQLFVELVAAGKRPDGTYNNCREALERKAQNLLVLINSVNSIDGRT